MYKILYLPTAEYVIIDYTYQVNLKVAPKSWFESLIQTQRCVFANGRDMSKPWFPGSALRGITENKYEVKPHFLEIIEVPDV